MYLLNYCISEPYTDWKRENIMVILLQNVVLNTRIKKFMGQLDKALNSLFSDWYKKLEMTL
jgi:hypothetical protein